MLFDLDITDGEWFPFIRSRHDAATDQVIWGELEPDAKVKIRDPQPFFEDRLKKRKKVVEQVLNPVTRAMERQSHYQDPSTDELIQENLDAQDYSIMEFDGFIDRSGKIIECTKENKSKMMKDPTFERFYRRCLKEIKNANALQTEAADLN